MTNQIDDWVGQQLAHGRYHVTSKLGEGGMGFVYRARDQNLDTDVVIKVPRPALMQDPEFAGRFTRETRVLVKLAHAHVVKINEVGEHAGLPFVVLQFLAGGSLRDRPFPMAPADLRGWLADVAAALDFIHQKGYVHRDVKPENVLFDDTGHVYLSDFGIAKALADDRPKHQQTVMTGTGMVIGTPLYMAPEVLLGKPYDGRADQYALAVMVYEVLSGRYPYEGGTAAAVMALLMTQAPPSLDAITAAPASVAQAVRRGLAMELEQRFATCKEFAEAVLKEAAAPVAAPRTMPMLAPRMRLPAAQKTTVGRVTCPTCGKKFKLPPGAEGKRLRCPACQTAIQTTPLTGAMPGTQTAQPTPASVKYTPKEKEVPPVPSREQGRAVNRSVVLWIGCVTVLLVALLGVAVVTWLPRQSPSGVQTEVAQATLLTTETEPVIEPKKPLKDEPKIDPKDELKELPKGEPKIDPKDEAVIESKKLPKDEPKIDPKDESKKLPKDESKKQPIPDKLTLDLGKGVTLELVRIKAGSFLMGCLFSDKDASTDESPQHEVTISKDFYLGKYLVTQEQYEQVIQREESWFSAEGRGKEKVDGLDTRRFPVEMIQLWDAEKFCKQVSAMTGRRVELPTEAEWEYACRANTQTRYYSGDNLTDKEANFGSKVGRTTEVGKYPANPWGLYDMSGNVWQWCADGKRKYTTDKCTDPVGPVDHQHVLRGGSWNFTARNCRCSSRYMLSNVDRAGSHCGFRLAIRVAKTEPAATENSGVSKAPTPPAGMERPNRAGEQDHRQVLKPPETAEEFWAELKREISIGSYVIAAQHLEGFLKAPPKDKNKTREQMLLEIEKKEGMSSFLQLRNVPKWSDNPKIQRETKKAVEDLIKQVSGALEKHLKKP